MTKKDKINKEVLTVVEGGVGPVGTPQKIKVMAKLGDLMYVIAKGEKIGEERFFNLRLFSVLGPKLPI